MRGALERFITTIREALRSTSPRGAAVGARRPGTGRRVSAFTRVVRASCPIAVVIAALGHIATADATPSHALTTTRCSSQCTMLLGVYRVRPSRIVMTEADGGTLHIRWTSWRGQRARGHGTSISGGMGVVTRAPIKVALTKAIAGVFERMAVTFRSPDKNRTLHFRLGTEEGSPSWIRSADCGRSDIEADCTVMPPTWTPPTTCGAKHSQLIVREGHPPLAIGILILRRNGVPCHIVRKVGRALLHPGINLPQRIDGLQCRRIQVNAGGGAARCTSGRRLVEYGFE